MSAWLPCAVGVKGLNDILRFLALGLECCCGSTGGSWGGGKISYALRPSRTA